MTDKQVEVTVLESLTVEEMRERLRLERKVEKAFYEAGVALQALRDKRLYRSTHPTFEEYCRERFGFTKRSAYYLIDSVLIVDNLQKSEPLVHKMPTSERQCRPLKRLKSPKRQQEAWAIAVEQAGGKVPTAKIVKEVVDRFIPKKIKSRRTAAELNSNRTQPKTEYVSLEKAQIGQNVRVKPHHPLFALKLGVIVQVPNNRSAIVELENKSRELIDLQDLEIQRIVESNGTVKSPVEGPNRIPGMGLDWYIKVDEDTFKALDIYAREKGIPTLERFL